MVGRDAVSIFDAMIGLVIALALTLAAAGEAHAAFPLLEVGRNELQLQRPEGVRSYTAIIPENAPRSKAALVIALHGLGGSGAVMIDQGRWDEAARRHGFIVLGPDGTVERAERRPRFFGNPRSWNAGAETGSSASVRGVDDVGFIRALIDAWIAAGRVDPDRIYVTGFSNGAGMAFRAGVDLSDRVAAIAPVANALLIPAERLAQPVSLIMIWGDADPLNPYGGGKVRRTAGSVERPGAFTSLQRWRSLIGCDASKRATQKIEPTVALDASGPCKDGSEAVLYSIAGMGHQWPGGKVFLRSVSGPGSDALDATETIWRFFERHPRRKHMEQP